MPDSSFDNLRDYLLTSGMSPRYVRRAVAELEDHRADLFAEAESLGLSGAAAASYASERLGDPEAIGRCMAQIEGHRAWIYRYPRLARFYLPVIYFAAVPFALVTADGGEKRGFLRWGAAMMLSAAVTAAMLLGMQLAIIFG
jgi:hypothetical protein